MIPVYFLVLSFAKLKLARAKVSGNLKALLLVHHQVLILLESRLFLTPSRLAISIYSFGFTAKSVSICSSLYPTN